MKKLLLILSMAVTSLLSYGQNSAVTNAALYHQDGIYDKALEEINNASKHEKTRDEPKTWYLRGLIYQSLVGTEKPEWKSIAANAEEESFSSYQKAIELDQKKGEYYRNSKTNLNALYPTLINNGVQEYSGSHFNEAIKKFELAQQIHPEDSTGYIYGAYAAEALKRYDLLSKYVSKLDAIGFKNEQTWLYKIAIASEQEKNAAKALEISKEGQKEFPRSAAILQEQTNLYIVLGNKTEALKNLKILHAANPNSLDYIGMLGSLYDQTGDKQEALLCYNKALSIDPNHFLSLYNSGVIFYEQGKKTDAEIHKMDMNTYHTEGKKKEAEEEELFGKALERANKALGLATEETDKKNIKILIQEINKVKADEQVYKSLHK